MIFRILTAMLLASTSTALRGNQDNELVVLPGSNATATVPNRSLLLNGTSCSAADIGGDWNEKSTGCNGADPGVPSSFSSWNCTKVESTCTRYCKNVAQCGCGVPTTTTFTAQVCLKPFPEINVCWSKSLSIQCTPGKCEQKKIGLCASVKEVEYSCRKQRWFFGNYIEEKTIFVRKATKEASPRPKTTPDYSCEGCVCPKKTGVEKTGLQHV